MRYVMGVLVLALVLAGCGTKGEELLRPSDIYEYGDLVCSTENVPDGATWDDLQRRLKDDIELAENVVPPSEVYDFHFANIALLRVLLAGMSEKDGKALANPYEINTTSEVIIAFAVWEDIIDDMGRSQAYQTLAVKGCFD